MGDFPMQLQETTWTRRFLPGLATLARYERAWFRLDLVAGVSVAAVAVPIAIALAPLAGVPAVHGLYASILPLVVYAFFGTSPQLIIAPDPATCVMVATIVMPLAGGDPNRIIPLTMVLTMLTGTFCIVAGLARLGFLTNFLARPILVGYLNGVALSIIVGQLGSLFGFLVEPVGFFRLLINFFATLGQTHKLTLATGLAAFVLLRLLMYLAPKIPAPLVVMALGIAASSFFSLGQHGVELLGSIPAGLPALLIPNIAGEQWGSLVLGAAGLALVSFNSGMVTARGFAVRNRYDIDSNQEFIALGVADLGAGLMQGFAVSGADSRTAVNDSIGGKTQVTGLVAAGLIVLVLLFLTAPLALLPITVLAAVLVNAVLGLFDLNYLTKLWRVSRQELFLSMAASLGVITVGVLPGVVIAVGLAMLQLVAKTSKPPDALLGRVPGAGGFQDIEHYPQAETQPGLMIYRFEASLLFFNSDFFKARVRAFVKAANPRPRLFLLDAGTMPYLDTTGAACLEEVVDELSAQGIGFAVVRARGQVDQMLERTGLKLKIGERNFFSKLETAVSDLGNAVEKGPRD
jgi:high affinity sulfate transporter 1